MIRFGASPTRTSTFATTELQYSPGGEEGLLYLLLSALSRRSQKEEDIKAAEVISGISPADLEPVISLLAGSKEVAIVAGDDLLRQSFSGRIFA